jgi:hypothetical protein
MPRFMLPLYFVKGLWAVTLEVPGLAEFERCLTEV